MRFFVLGAYGTTRTFLHSMVEILLQLAECDSPFDMSFSALFEPALRFLVSMNIRS